MCAIFDIDHIRDCVDQRAQQVALLGQSALRTFAFGNIADRTD